VNDQDPRSTRIRHTATGALAALAVVGAIAGTAALAAKPGAKTHRRAAVVNASTTKTAPDPYAPTPAGPGKTGAAPPPANPQPFLNAIQRIVENGTITAAEGQTVDRQIQTGRVDTDTLASSGFTPTQLQAVQQALSNTKRALGHAAPPAAPPGAPGKNGTPQQDAKTRRS
jgi:hypothetical protein